MVNRTQGLVPAPSLPPGSLQKGSEGAETPRTWQIAASDLVFLWEECRACFYRKVARRQSRPRGPFPRLFSSIDGAMKRTLLGTRLEQVFPGAPAGVLGEPDRWVASAPLPVPGTTSRVVLRGRTDLLLSGDRGRDAVIDLKTASPKDPHLALYGRQLHSYAWALEHPARGRPRQMSTLGLLCFCPTAFSTRAGEAHLDGALRWLEIPRDDTSFSAFLEEVCTTLGANDPPASNPDCRWCALDGQRAPSAGAQYLSSI